MTSDAKQIDITPNQDGGILKEILREGTENQDQPVAGDTVFVHYVGTLLDGTKFDSSRDRGEKFSFTVGKGQVIKGWDLGILTMKRGELSKFTLTAEYGYGKTGSPPKIPGGATLVFEIELFDFHGEDISENSDKSIVRRILKEGSGYSMPNDGAKVVVNLKGKDKAGRVFDERNDVAFELGEGQNVNIIEGIEKALEKFKAGERAMLEIKAALAWGSEGHKEFGIEPNTDVIYEVELKEFEKAKESWQLNSSEKLEHSEILKDKGAEYFKEAKYAQAIKKYKKIVDFLQSEVYDLEEEKAKCNRLLVAANLNIAACSLKIKEYKNAIDCCARALAIEPKNEKGLFRMAQGYFGLTEFQDALQLFTKVLEINPQNKDAINHLAISKRKLKEHHDKERALYTKMLGL